MANVSYDNFLSKTNHTVSSSPVSYSSFQEQQISKQKNSKVSYQAYLDAKENPPIPFYQKVVQGIKDYATENKKITREFPSRILHPIETTEKIFKAFTDPFVAGVTKAGTLPKGGSNTVTDVARLLSGSVEAMLSPVTGVFKIAEHVPVLKQVADILNIPFSLLGMAGSWGTGKIVDALPGVSDETKDIIRQPLQEVGSLATQIILGGKIMEKIGNYTKDGKTLGPEEAKKIVVESKNEVTHIKLNTSKVRYQDYLKSQGYEPYTPPSELPTIQMGPKPKPSIPEIQTEPTVVSKSPSLKYEPVIDETKVKTSTPIETGVETKPTKLADTLQKESFAKNVKADFGDIPEYRTMNMDAQRKLASDLLDKSPEYVKNILERKAPMPSGDLKIGSLYSEVKSRAIDKGDVKTILDLSKSKINELASAYGQEVKAFDAQLEKGIIDPVRAIQDIKRSRQSVENKPNAKRILNEDIVNMKKEIKAKNPTKGDWEAFIRSIEC